MPQLLVRNIDAKTLEYLKNRAKLHHRSLQGEIIFILEEAAHVSNLHKSSRSSNIIKHIIGGWQGEAFKRPEQGDYEQREELE